MKTIIIKLNTIEIQCNSKYSEPFNLVLKTVDDTLVSIPVGVMDLVKLGVNIRDFLEEFEEYENGEEK